MWVLIVKEEGRSQEQVCDSKAAAETRRRELMKKGVFATVTFRRDDTREFNSGRATRQPSAVSATALAGKIRKP